MLTTAAKNAALDALLPVDVSLHTAYSSSGANEVTGGSPAYARRAITFSAASSGTKSSSSTPTFDVPASTEVRFLGLWGLGSPSQFLGMFALGGSEKEIIGITLGSPEGILIVPSHGYSNGNKVVFYGGTPPTGLTEGTVYYVISASTDTFSVSATEGGAGIPLTGYPDGEVKVSKIVPESFGSQGTLQVSSASIAMNA
jgi:hypothetical protein